jgi:hypothetical protein
MWLTAYARGSGVIRSRDAIGSCRRGRHRELGLREAQSKTAGRRTGTRDEAWYTGASWYVTTKSSFCAWDVLYNLATMQGKRDLQRRASP